ncbi:MAG: 3-oxoacyl-ACP reductase [Rariglobus sp.]|jgi:NAD(P)-dependent dehydrogenase (short-subunit alcohol dehydrogenase family)|nr:3-oxoacyl-ACP reductase [Rariglobus sp.]
MTPTPSPLPDFTGHTVLVTGSTQNLGHTIAMFFARAGARTILHGRALADAQGACDRIRAESPAADVHAVHFSLGDAGEVDAAFADLGQRGLMPDILINNAAHLGLGADTTFLGQTPEFFNEVIDANLVGTFRCSQLAALEMRTCGKGGSIINITSLAGERPIWGRSAYCASKAALEGLTRSMSLELAQHDIQVNCISAGYIWTPRWNNLAPEHVERRRKNTPGHEPTQQEEIARLTLFLASRQAPTLIGSRIVIDGGLNAQQVPSDATV